MVKYDILNKKEGTHFDMFDIHQYLQWFEGYTEYKKRLPQQVPRCVEFFEHYRSCFHPKVLLWKQIISCHNVWKRALALMSEEHEEEDDETSWIYHFKDDYSDKNNSLCELIQSLSDRITLNHKISVFALQSQDDINNAQVNEVDLQTLYCSVNELSKLLVLRKLTRFCAQMSETLFNKIEDLRSQVIHNTATRRLQESLYKLLGAFG
jgi:hypothetical protein